MQENTSLTSKSLNLTSKSKALTRELEGPPFHVWRVHQTIEENSEELDSNLQLINIIQSFDQS